MGSSQSSEGESAAPQQQKATLTEDERKKYYEGPNVIQLAYSVLGGVPGAQAYHTSVVINGTEFFFDGSGIMSTTDFSSHRQPEAEGAEGVKNSNSQSTQIDSGGGQKMGPPKYQLTEFGGSKKSSQELLNALSPYFQADSYDLLRKNCNSFSDCAIFFLTGQRIPTQFRQLEKIGEKWGGETLLKNQGYEKNKNADGFDCEKICEKFDVAKMWSSPGYAVGGTSSETLTPAQMRAKRLEALERQEAAAKAEKEKNGG